MRIFMVAAVLGWSLLGPVVQAEGADTAKQSTNIPAQALAPALRSLAKERHFQIVFASKDVADLKTRGVSGELTQSEALTELLNGTGMTFRYVDEKTVTIVPVGASAAEVSLTDPLRVAQAASGKDESQAGGSAAESPKLEEVVVTAQKRSERLQDVPISLSVVSGRDLDRSNILNINEVLNVSVPGIATTHNSFPGTTQLSVRGVTAAGMVLFGASPIGYYVDSVPFGFVRSALVPDLNGYDVQQVETLRGPQGTLYGVNAVNGVVRVLTNDADLSKIEFKTRVSGSTMDSGGDSYRGDMAVNVPLIQDKLAARVVASYAKSAGWIDNLVKRDTNDTKAKDLRLKLNAAPTDALSIGLSYWHSRTDLGAFNMASDQDVYPGILETPTVTRFDITGLRVGYQLPWVSISSSTSYIDYGNHNNYDITPFATTFGIDAWYGTLGYNEFNSKVFSQEINLVSKAQGVWKWSAGAFYRDDKDGVFQSAPYFIPSNQFGDQSKSFAVFGELTREFMGGKFALTGGGRYFRDRVINTAVPPLPPGGDPQTFHHVSPRAVLTWHPAAQMTGYVSYGEGFRSGLIQDPFSRTNAPGYPPAKPDTLHNYEVGLKGALLDGRITYDSAVYYMDWKDVQQQLLQPVRPGVNAIVFVNSSAASGPGVDLNIVTRPATGLELGFNMSWNDLNFDDDVKTGDAILFHKGDRLNASPEYTFGALAGYSFPLGASLRGRIAATGSYHSAQVQQSTAGVLKGDVLRNVRVGFSVDAGDRWTAEVFSDNLTNDRGNIAIADPSATFYNVRTTPRTVGLQVEYRFQ